MWHKDHSNEGEVYTVQDVDRLTGWEDDARGTAERAEAERVAHSLPAAFRRVPQTSETAPIVREVAIDGETGLPGARVAHVTGGLDRMTEADIIATIDEGRRERMRETGERRLGTAAPKRLLHRHPATFPW